MNLSESYLLLCTMVILTMVASLFFKGRISWVTPTIFVACAVVTVIAGMGIKIREITEGAFAYLDSSMQILCGAAFCFLLHKNGTFQYIFNKIIRKKRKSVLQLMLIVLFIALPGMFTGTALMSIVTTGLMAGQYLLDKGVKKSAVVEVVSFGSLLGAIMPPLCMPAMLTTVGRQGIYPGSFEGFFLPCLLAAVPTLVVYCVMAGDNILKSVEEDSFDCTDSALCLIPLITVAALIICHNFLYTVTPFLGYPLIYVIGIILAAFLGVNRTNPLKCVASGIGIVSPEVALMCAFGAVIETLTVVGVNGTVSAQLLLNNMNVELYSAILMIAALIMGVLFGPCVGFVFGGFVTYIVSTGVQSSGCGMAMLSLGLLFCIMYYSARHGGIVEYAIHELGVPDVSTKEILKKTWIPMSVLFVIVISYFVCRTYCANLMI